MEKKSFFKHNLFSSWKKKITCFYTWFLSFSWKKKNSQNISLDTWKGRFMFVLNFVFFLLEFFCSSISHPNIFLVSQNERKNLGFFFLFLTFLFSAWKKKIMKTKKSLFHTFDKWKSFSSGPFLFSLGFIYDFLISLNFIYWVFSFRKKNSW